MSLAAQSFSAAVNHLLDREAWARDELARFAGKRACLVAPPVALMVSIDAKGRLLPAEGVDAAPPDVTLTLAPQAYGAWLQGGRAGAMRHVRIEGDAELAATLGKLGERLRWEPEEDLAQWLGDAPAHRIGTLGRATFARAMQFGRGFVGAAADYLLDENPQLVRVEALHAVQARLDEARDDVARLEKRIERLEGQLAEQAAAAAAKPARKRAPAKPRTAAPAGAAGAPSGDAPSQSTE